MNYGTLLTLSPGARVDALGLSESRRRLAQAITDYGIYVIDEDAPMTDPRIEAAARAIYAYRVGPVGNADFKRQLHLWDDCMSQAKEALAAADAVAPDAVHNAALDEAMAAWTEAAHGLEPDEVEEGSYHAGWDDALDIYRNAIRALKGERG